MDSMPIAQQRDAILDIHGLTKLFGGLRAVSDFDMDIPVGGLYGLIGPNGAGKTTVFNMITGIYVPTEGAISFNDADVVGMAPRDITRLGVARTFQNIRLFQNLTVLDNVRIAYHTHAGYNLLEAVTGWAGLARKNGRSPRRRRISWPCSACKIVRSRSPRTCPTASSAAWRSPVPWPLSRVCCCWTSRRRA